MKRINQLFLILICFLVFVGNTFAAVDIDADQNGAVDTEYGGTNSKTTEGALENLGILSVLTTKQAASNALTELSGTTPGAFGLSWLNVETVNDASELLSIKRATQPITADNNQVITPNKANVLYMPITGNASPTYVTWAKSGLEEDGDEVIISFSGTNNVVFADQPGILELDGTYSFDPGIGSMTVRFNTDRWYQSGKPSGTDFYFKDINSFDQLTNTYGTSQTAYKTFVTSGDLNLGLSGLNSKIKITGAGTITIPADTPTTALSGVNLEFIKTTAAQAYFRALDSSAVITLANGTDLAAGNILDLGTTAGTTTKIIGFDAGKFQVIGTGTDGGAPSGGAGTYLTDADVIAAYYFENNATDETANGYDLTASSMAYITATPTPPQGTYAADFATAYGESSNAAFDATLTGNFSITGWVYFDAEQWGVIASMGATTATSNRGWEFHRHDNNNAFLFAISTDGTTLLRPFTATGTAPINEWIHFAVVLDGTYIRVYINGYESTGASFPYSFSSTANDTTANFRVGTGYVEDISRPLNGKLDEFYVISRALTSEEVLDIYTNGLE